MQKYYIKALIMFLLMAIQSTSSIIFINDENYNRSKIRLIFNGIVFGIQCRNVKDLFIEKQYNLFICAILFALFALFSFWISIEIYEELKEKKEKEEQNSKIENKPKVEKVDSTLNYEYGGDGGAYYYNPNIYSIYNDQRAINFNNDGKDLSNVKSYESDAKKDEYIKFSHRALEYGKVNKNSSNVLPGSITFNKHYKDTIIISYDSDCDPQYQGQVYELGGVKLKQSDMTGHFYLWNEKDKMWVMICTDE